MATGTISTTRNFPQLFRCSFSNRNTFHCPRLVLFFSSKKNLGGRRRERQGFLGESQSFYFSCVCCVFFCLVVCFSPTHLYISNTASMRTKNCSSILLENSSGEIDAIQEIRSTKFDSTAHQ